MAHSNITLRRCFDCGPHRWPHARVAPVFSLLIRKLIIVRNAAMICPLTQKPCMRASFTRARRVSDWLQIGYIGVSWIERIVRQIYKFIN